MILITRPIDDASNLTEILSRKGYSCIIEPMLEIQKFSPSVKKAAIYITTSNNAEEFVPNNGVHISIPKNGKNAAEIVEHVVNNYTPEDGKIIYLRGDVITLDIKTALKELGFDVEEVVVYKSAAPEELSEALLKDIYKVQVATFFSEQSFLNFEELAKKHKLKEALKGIKVLALSEKIAKKANKFDWKGIYSADLPNQQSLIERLEEIL